MKKKVLVVASTSDHLITFHKPYISELKKTCDVFTMAKDTNQKFADFNIDFQKKIVSFKHFSIIKSIRKVLQEQQFDVIFLNTSLAAILVRLAVKGMKNKPKVINIVHGYLFGEKSSFVKRTVFLAIEKWVRKVTSNIVVMNNEDYDIATKHKLCTGKVFKINGMGINERFKSRAKSNTGVEDELVFSFIGELSDRKNQMFLIKFIKELEKYDINAKLNLIGDGGYKTKLEDYVKKQKLENKVNMIGYVNDIESYVNSSNYYICASKIEGLPFNILEAMFAGSVVFSSDIKGAVDLIEDLENGVLFKLNDMNDLINKFRLVKNNLELQEKIRKNATETAKKYLFSEVFNENTKLFIDLLN